MRQGMTSCVSAQCLLSGFSTDVDSEDSGTYFSVVACNTICISPHDTRLLFFALKCDVALSRGPTPESPAHSSPPPLFVPFNTVLLSFHFCLVFLCVKTSMAEGSATEAKMSAESRTLARESPIRPMYFEARITRISYTLGRSCDPLVYGRNISIKFIRRSPPFSFRCRLTDRLAVIGC